MSTFSFEIIHTSRKSAARVGIIHTPHGDIATPGFVAVGTNGTIKALDTKMVESIGLELMFCNTYHLLLQPGPDVIEYAGGLHRFMNRSMPLITDSGGFQVFSLAYGSVASELKSSGAKRHDTSVIRITEEGVLFRSYRDGHKVLLTPESSVDAQKKLGADIIVPFDELPPYHMDSHALKASLERTHRWERRSLEHHKKNENDQAMYAVIHGGIDTSLRERSARELLALPFDGCAIGGSLGKNRAEMVTMLTALRAHLPPELPRHLLGIGDVASLDACIPLGIDTFDSSYPTRSARHGVLLADAGSVRIAQATHAYALEPIQAGCNCFTCTHYTRAYLHHLFKARELTFMTLATIHNLHAMVRRMQQYREAILAGRL